MKKTGIAAGILLIGLGLFMVWQRLQTRLEEKVNRAVENALPAVSPSPMPTLPPTGESVTPSPAQGIPAPVPSAEPTAELRSELARVAESLPRITSLKGMKEEDVAHRAPPQVVEAGAALGDLAEYLERRPSEFKSATPFYAQCALNEQLLPAARALCLHALSEKPAEWAPGVKESVDRVPPEIADLASQL